MTSRERILAVVERRPVDRLPVDLWLTPEALDGLKRHVGCDDEWSLYGVLGVDKLVWAFPGYGRRLFDPNQSEGMDPWGVPTVTVRAGSATYQEYGAGPLATYTDVSQLDDYPGWPDPERFDFAGAGERARSASARQFAVIGPWISVFETYCHLRGMENALADVIEEPGFLDQALDRIEAIQTSLLERYLGALGDVIDLVFISDDLGTQGGKLMSVAAFERHLKARIKHWCDLTHAHGKKVLFHTDGAARDFIPHLIECGVDVLNPIQHVCPGMAPKPLKRDFGADLVFHGGIDNQHVLPHGTVEDVRREVAACIGALGANGGYIPCSCHNIQAGTPPENIVAMIEAVQRFG